MLRNKHTHYITQHTNKILEEVAKKSKTSKGKIIEALVERYFVDRIKILTEEANHHNDEMIKRHKEIKRIKELRDEEEKKKLKL